MGKGIASQYNQAHINICGSCFHKDVCGSKDYLTENQCCNFVDDLESTPAEIEALKDKAEILERAIHGDCGYCIYEKSYKVPASCKNFNSENTSKTCYSWKFDQARFSGKKEDTT